MWVIGYVRVSTEEQSREGVSLAAQADRVAAFSSLHDLELVESIADAGASAKSLDRPGLARALDMLDSGDVAGLVVFKLDRLTRNLGDWSGLIDRYFGEKSGRSLMSVSESIDTRTAAGRMVLNIMMTVAQWERETIVERTRSAVDFKRSRGERISRRIPYGKALAPDGRALLDAPDELAMIEAVRAWRAEGWTLAAIVAELTRRGVPTRTGRPWAITSVQAILRRPR